MRTRFGWILVLLLGCHADRPEAWRSDSTTSRSPPAHTETPAAATTATAGADAGAPNSGAFLLTIEGEGLRLQAAETGASRALPFGLPRETIMRALASSLNEGAPEEGSNPECRIDYAAWPDQLTLWFADGHFVGWSLGAPGRDLTTANGIGIGSTRAEVEAAYPIEVAPSSLGVEFSAGGLAGLLDGTGPDARVQNLWAGHVCIAR